MTSPCVETAIRELVREAIPEIPVDRQDELIRVMVAECSARIRAAQMPEAKIPTYILAIDPSP